MKTVNVAEVSAVGVAVDPLLETTFVGVAGCYRGSTTSLLVRIRGPLHCSRDPRFDRCFVHRHRFSSSVISPRSARASRCCYSAGVRSCIDRTHCR